MANIDEELQIISTAELGEEVRLAVASASEKLADDRDADISAELAVIQNGRYGADIRQAIHDALDKLQQVEPPSPSSGGGVAGQLTAIFGGVLSSISGYAAEVGFVYKGTAASSAQFTVPLAGHFKLMAIAVNSEASTFALNLAVQVNGIAVETEAVAYNAYSGSGTNRRNHRVVSYSAYFAAGDIVRIDLTERSGYTSFVYALLDETYPFGNLAQTISTADATASGSYSADAIALYGTFNSDAGGTIRIADVAAGTTITTDNPGTNYKSAYIFWFEKEVS
jgi:hypothetical protein